MSLRHWVVGSAFFRVDTCRLLTRREMEAHLASIQEKRQVCQVTTGETISWRGIVHACQIWTNALGYRLSMNS